MAVRCAPPTSDSLLPVAGIALGTAAARIKNWTRDDVLLVVTEPGTVAAGVFTQNRFCAAPVIVCRAHLEAQHTSGFDFRALVVNAGIIAIMPLRSLAVIMLNSVEIFPIACT